EIRKLSAISARNRFTDAVLHVSSVFALNCFVFYLLLKDLKTIDKDCYKIAKRDNLFTCFVCELESIPSAAVEANSIPLQQSRPKRNRKPNPRYDQSSPKRRNAAVIPFSDSVTA
ncbi:Uncharacterized protein APZ42_007946, partial [Daphnia magna]